MTIEPLLKPTAENFLKILAEHTQFKGVHPAAMIFPFTSGEDYENLCRGIKENGQMEAIKVTPEGLLIDGRTRLLACYQALIDPYVVETETDPWLVSKAANLERRNLTTGQRAVIGLRLEEHYAEEAKERQGERNDLKEEHCGNSATKLKNEKSRDKAAKDVGVGQKAVSKAKYIEKNNPDGVKKIMNNESTLEEVYKETKQKVNSQSKPSKEEKPVVKTKMADEKLTVDKAVSEALEGLPKTATKKVKQGVKRVYAQLQVEFSDAVKKATKERMKSERAEIDKLREGLNERKREVEKECEALSRIRASVDYLMTQKEYKLVLSCLHPDKQPESERAKFGKAFEIFNRLKDTVNPEYNNWK